MPEKRAAVVIGVDRVATLPSLSAAASGATKFAQWARSQGFDVELITDQNGIVSGQMIRDAIKKFVNAQQYAQLVIYFAGHGVLRGPDYELWLLSEAPGDPNEAVVVPLSIVYARNCGIGHIVWISDACRSVPDTPLMNGVTGNVIFPNKAPQTPRPAVDLFYATLPGDPAYEVKVNEAVKNYRGLFTDCLLAGLQTRPNVVMAQRTAPPPPWIIPSWKMKLYLEECIPRQAAAVRIDLVQSPDIRVESRDPACLAECPDYSPPTQPMDTQPQLSPPPTGGNGGGGARGSGGGGAHGSGGARPEGADVPGALTTWSRESPSEPPDTVHLLEHVAFLPARAQELVSRYASSTILDKRTIRAAAQLLNASGRQSFETRTGFTIIGSDLKNVAISGVKTETFIENEAWNIRVYWEKPIRVGRSLLLQFGKGNGAVISPIHGFIGTIVIENDRVVNVSYIPSAGSDNYLYYMDNKEKIDKRHAYIAAAARQGAFRIDPAKAEDAAEYLRILKSVDPTFGLYAAYAYAQVGNLDGVKSIFEYMSEAPEPIPFDVALLANKLPEHVGTTETNVAPCCPMLTQGWALLDPSMLPEPLQEARKHLIPSLWTTFSAQGVEIVRQAIEGGFLL
jgi:hypothetical protein